ncbi:uncharacterized protein LOC108164224 [Drosophila miranda]|uniref:uncharacterized protein LOC108164224 n=1 Tax=Drosophila miranda TaxID=7229 RepID=UPI0007E64D0D|nr:uncharacterized protein LOC108164224 [Drosophila miranda]XP_017155355.1 uncharacterized protein LOC108164224 [Drosophila miranda]XP_017155363.1 uncharacterized protein LOC108164224 [Drosophila miranda]XP_017155369.1 uncharacterized protein LOC108164224 [Drosophila miranda]XP_017155383.1 uncharacterized protein LOC108164224 [Drosophila miranda]XP_017155404.1 uncharacterized protein LOC108164224 [Drosophila miranda]XP_033249538.1 uncharacterized protein LOC108164224 [Drosophila miranda]XP_0
MAPKNRIARVPAAHVAARSSNGKLSVGTQTGTQICAAPSRVPTRPKIITGKDQLSMIRRGVKRASQPAHFHVVPKERFITARASVAGAISPPLANEKACQATPVGKELKIRRPTAVASSRPRQIPPIPMEETRKESVYNKEVKRLKYLMEIVNADKPPNWSLASDMWREIDYLERRIDAYQNEKPANRAPK